MAHEGGVSFWVPGTFGSLAATPQQPGWSLASIYYSTSMSAGGGVSLSRELTIGANPLEPDCESERQAECHRGYCLGHPELCLRIANPRRSGGREPDGNIRSNKQLFGGTLTGTLATPLGTVPFTRSDGISDSVTGFGDLYPQISLRWNNAVNAQRAMAIGHFVAGHYPEALSLAERIVRTNPDNVLSNSILAASSALVERFDVAEKAVARLHQLYPQLRISGLMDITPFRRPEDRARWIEGLRKAGLPE